MNLAVQQILFCFDIAYRYAEVREAYDDWHELEVRMKIN